MSSLSCHDRTGERVARRRSSDSAGTYETDAPGRETAGGHRELPLTPPRYASAHRTRCGEGVGPVSPAGASKQKQRNAVRAMARQTRCAARDDGSVSGAALPFLPINRHVQHRFPGEQAEQFKDLLLPGDQPFLVGLRESLKPADCYQIYG